MPSTLVEFIEKDEIVEELEEFEGKFETEEIIDYIHDNYIKFSFANMYNFGFQKGKCAHMAMGEIATILDTKIEKVCKVCNN
jgi:hypothetical protein